MAAHDDAWRRVKAYRNVDAARVQYLTDQEANRLANACESDFRDLVIGALMTGCRYGELIALTANNFEAQLAFAKARAATPDILLSRRRG